MRSVLYLVLFCMTTICGVTVATPWGKYPSLKHVRSYTDANEQTQAVQDLIKRIIGDRSVDFEAAVDIPFPSSETDIAVITSPSIGKIKISGTSGVAVAFAFNYYLKYFCNKHMSWAGDNLKNLPNPLPPVPNGKLELDAGVKYRYYQNVCTDSYSYVWWTWDRWQREVDWMAMNGINLPLAYTGQEAIWRRVYKALGCSDEDMNEYFPGPAFLAWNRMGNMFKWGGPLPQDWMDYEVELQHLILNRQRSLGMIPVLPAFAGHIPEAIMKLYLVNVSREVGWGSFNSSYSCVYFLEPSEPLFQKIGKMFLMEQTIEYGTNHIYNADMFNEMTPRTSDPAYIASASQAVFNAMTAVDDKAIWMMQAWLFQETYFWKQPQMEALVTAVPLGRMLILDLFSEVWPKYQVTHSYYGQPFIWCMLHNFGGNTGFHGKIETINTGPGSALSFVNSTMVGTGITPEAIGTNYFVYDLMLEVGFLIKQRNLTDWTRRFAERRYGSSNANALNAWSLLASTVYNDTNPIRASKLAIRGPLLDRPNTDPSPVSNWYDPKSILKVWDEFMPALQHLDDMETVRYDTVDITRQVLQYFHSAAHDSLVKAFNESDEIAAMDASELLLLAIDDMESILLTEEHFLLGKWISDARAFGFNDAEKDFFESNARFQVTTWGPADGRMVDYASRHWASLVSHYYRPRWVFFIETVMDCIRNNKPFDHKKFSQDIFSKIEHPFTQDRTVFPSEPTGSAIDVAEKIYKRWRSMPLQHQRPK